jgi:hypothetical protein
LLNRINHKKMKKLLLSLSALALLATSLNAQVGTAPVMGFETWHQIAPPFVTSEDPNGWASLNALVGVTATPLSVSKETASPAAGAITAKITTVKITGATIPSPYGGNLDTAGILAVGSVAFASPPVINYGFTFAAKPMLLSFQSKYTPMAGDSAFVLVYMTHWNGSSRDTIGTGKYATGASTSSYATNTVTVTYKPAFSSVTPDSMQIFISSSVYSHDGAKVGSAFWIDALAWSAFVGINDVDASKNKVTVYPNPAADHISIKSSVDAKAVQVMDITGKIIGSYDMSANEAVIETAEYAAGIYTYLVLDKNRIVLNHGKFEVAH